jgi:hypothetical protein
MKAKGSISKKPYIKNLKMVEMASRQRIIGRNENQRRREPKGGSFHGMAASWRQSSSWRKQAGVSWQ